MDYKELKSLSEAYQSVYSPQELIEEQAWEEVENWVHSLLEEGYDLSDYTWEEMYEYYLNEVVSTPPPVAMDAFASGGGAAKMAKSGMTRDQVIAQGNKNNTKLSTTTFTKPTTPAAPAPAAPAPRPAATPEKPMGGDPMDQWARANPTLAAKVKPGSSGYNTIKTRLDADNDRQENYDAYDLVLSHLINEGYADTYEAAEVIMVNMSEDWRQSIIEKKYDPDENLPSGRTPNKNMTRAQNRLGAIYMTEPSSSRFADRRVPTTKSSSLDRGRKNLEIQNAIKSGQDPRNVTFTSKLDGIERQIDLRQGGRPGVTPEDRASRTGKFPGDTAHTQGGLRANKTKAGGYRGKKKKNNEGEDK